MKRGRFNGIRLLRQELMRKLEKHRLLPPHRVGAGTGLYNGLSVLFGGVGGSLIPSSIVAVTGSFDAAIFSIVVGALLAAFVMLVLARTLRY
ncbi:hypothetical protein [Chroococcidiopsis thermalis]|uniref:Uncharacterized protein n=1 Tax=Chroococcidiopsis thermalis (strain PCC 7203) TaxID=251229 RepID=K9TYP7_CHRTP|nr:hypothetical protein [Chroococcidiopsis thermalis]AFY87705.1 hypothetical protein Chro_2206 [Chroococcidiopsis thermalis PCC 7203]